MAGAGEQVEPGAGDLLDEAPRHVGAAHRVVERPTGTGSERATRCSSAAGRRVSGFSPRIVKMGGAASMSLRIVAVSRNNAWNHAISAAPNCPLSSAPRRPICWSSRRTTRSVGGIRVANRRSPGRDATRITSGTAIAGAPNGHPSTTSAETRSGWAAAARSAW